MSYLSGGEENNLINNRDNISLDSRKSGIENEISYLDNLVSRIGQSEKQDTPNISSQSIYNNLNNLNNSNYEYSNYNSNNKNNENNIKQNKKKLQTNPNSNKYTSINSGANNSNINNQPPTIDVSEFKKNLEKYNKKNDLVNEYYSQKEVSNKNYLKTSNSNNKNQNQIQINYSNINQQYTLSKNVFKEFELGFSINENENIEQNIKKLRDCYEKLISSLEEALENNKSSLESYYKGLIKETLNAYSQQSNTPQLNLPIINITKEHSIKLNELREIFDEKLKEAEKNFYFELRGITTFFNSNN